MKKLFMLMGMLSILSLSAMQPCTLSCKSSKGCQESDDGPTSHVNFFVNALYWQAREDGLDYMIKNSNGSPFINCGTVERVEFDAHGGFRVGVGYCHNCCPVGVSAYYTRYNASGCDKRATTFPTVLFPVWSNPSTTIVTEQNAQARICLSMSMFDVHANTVLSPNDCVSIMPVLGLRYASIKQQFNINANGGQSGGPFAFVIDDCVAMQNDFRGVGPKVGINTIWGSWHGVSIFGAMDIALLYGKFDITQKENVEFTEGVLATTFLDIKCNRFHITRPNMGLILGLQWHWQKGRFDTCIAIGWEHQYFFGQNQLMRFSDDVNPGVNTAVQGDLAMQGLTVAVSVAF